MAQYEKILKDVKNVLIDQDTIDKILAEYPNKSNESRDEYVKNRKERIKKILALAGLNTEDDLQLYVEALQTSKSGYSIILERDIDELYVNSYNPEWARAWNGNHDLQICLDYFAVITYITEYYCKDDSGTMKALITALKESDTDTLKEIMILLMNTYICARQMGEAEALFKIFPDFHLKKSDVSTVFVPVNKRENRSKFLMKVDEKFDHPGLKKFKVDGREGDYIEKYDIVSKFERIEDKVKDLELSFSQFSKMYSPTWKEKQDKKESTDILDDDQISEPEEYVIEYDNTEKTACEDNCDVEKSMESTGIDEEIDKGVRKFDYIMKCSHPGKKLNYDHSLCKVNLGEKLPLIIKLKNPFPGEPPYMKRRKHPAVLRFHKFKIDTHYAEYFFSEALLYRPFRNEIDIEIEQQSLKGLDIDIYNEELQCVKSQVMEHLENVQEARYFVQEASRCIETGATLDPEGEQEIDDCEYEGLINHPDFPEFDLDAFEEEAKKKRAEKTTKQIEVDQIEILMEKTLNLDFYQRKVVEKGINYARRVVKSLKPWNTAPEATKIMIHGGAGSGKSTVINVLKQWVHLILQTSGDSTDTPYLLITGPTGTAAANIKGQTLHTAFGFSFGNEHYSLSDKKRDEKRTLLQKLRLVIIDEISMVKADQLYQLDMRLREVTQKPNKIFGQVAIFAFGDMLQLRPCQARYIFQEPKCEDYHLSYYSGTHWHSFEAINLEENHRQDSDRLYADILNRIRIGQVTEEDLDVLRPRIISLGHPDLIGAMYLTGTNAEVNKFNDTGLNQLNTDLVIAEAINIHPTIKNFKPHVNSKGNIGTEKNETPFRQTLKMKIKARIMLTYNIDVSDGLTNGTRGKIVAFENNSNGNLEMIIILFDETYQGEDRRKGDQKRQIKYPGCTTIERVMFQYSIGRKKTTASNTARVIQFPLKLCFAATAHKFQGQTVVKPMKLAVDLRYAHGAAMAYVMLSRVQSLMQLFIIETLPDKKIFADGQALGELQRLNRISINKNPPKWEKSENGIKVMAFNCRSLNLHFTHIAKDPTIQFGDTICLSETWLPKEFSGDNFHVDGFQLHTNSAGHGKGLATYFKEKIFTHSVDITEVNLQVTKLYSPSLDVISVYRSQEGSLQKLTDNLLSIVDNSKTTLICGDFNVCLKTSRNNCLSKTLKLNGFLQHVKEATHIKGGHIDHVYLKQGDQEMTVDVCHYSPYYLATDHDALLVTLEKPGNIVH